MRDFSVGYTSLDEIKLSRLSPSHHDQASELIGSLLFAEAAVEASLSCELTC